jgi:hypothetical protein
MSEPLKGLLRGAGYAAVFALLNYILQNLGTTFDPTVSAVITALIGAAEHYLTTSSPSLPSTPSQQ